MITFQQLSYTVHYIKRAINNHLYYTLINVCVWYFC